MAASFMQFALFLEFHCVVLFIFYAFFPDNASSIRYIIVFVIPPCSNAFFGWTRTCHVSWVKTVQLPNVNKTHSLPWKQQHELLTRT